METVVREGDLDCDHLYFHTIYDDGDEFIECHFCGRVKIVERGGRSENKNNLLS